MEVLITTTVAPNPTMSNEDIIGSIGTQSGITCTVYPTVVDTHLCSSCINTATLITNTYTPCICLTSSLYAYITKHREAQSPYISISVDICVSTSIIITICSYKKLDQPTLTGHAQQASALMSVHKQILNLTSTS